MKLFDIEGTKLDTAAREFYCGLVGHGELVFYNPSGYEPDYACKRCGIDTESICNSTRWFRRGLHLANAWFISIYSVTKFFGLRRESESECEVCSSPDHTGSNCYAVTGL